MAMKEKMVAGLDSVSANVPPKAPSRPRASRRASAAWSGGVAVQVRQASQSMTAPPVIAKGKRAPCRTWIKPLTP